MSLFSRTNRNHGSHRDNQTVCGKSGNGSIQIAGEMLIPAQSHLAAEDEESDNRRDRRLGSAESWPKTLTGTVRRNLKTKPDWFPSEAWIKDPKGLWLSGDLESTLWQLPA